MNVACQNDLEIVQVSHYINDEIKFIFGHSTYVHYQCGGRKVDNLRQDS